MEVKDATRMNNGSVRVLSTMTCTCLRVRASVLAEARQLSTEPVCQQREFALTTRKDDGNRKRDKVLAGASN